MRKRREQLGNRHIVHSGVVREWPRQQVSRGETTEYVEPPAGGYVLGDHDLPVASKRLELEQYFEWQANGEAPVGIVVGETGSGKTSNVPLAALETGLFSKIYVGEPRVVLARETMLRLRHNVVQQLGEKAVHLVGYATGLERDLHPDNQIIVGTYRLIRHKLEDADERELEDASLFVDEYHVREIEGDLLVEYGKLRDVPVTAVSATIDAERAARFHCGYDGSTPAPVIRIEGRQYPIHEMTMDDSTSAAVWATQRGLDTLYPLPGKNEIQAEMGRVSARQRHIALPLHAELTASQQRQAFEPSHGLPKVIYSTEIGGTGITPGVDAVVVPEIGRAMKLSDGIPVLGYERLSAARIKQYSGRTGRTGEGYVIRAPLAHGPTNVPPNTNEYDTPEVQRVRLDSTVLSLARAGMTLCDDQRALEHLHRIRLMDEPKQVEVYRAQERLRRLGALGVNLSTTEIGRDMARLPLDPYLGRMVVESRTESEQVRQYMIAAAAVGQVNGVAVTTEDATERWSSLSNETKSDLLQGLDVYLAAKQLGEQSYERYGILPQRMDRVDEQIMQLCEREGVAPFDSMVGPNEAEREVLRRCMLSGIDELYVRASTNGKYRDIVRGGDRMLPRESALSPQAAMVAATPWGLETYRENGPVRRLDFIKNVIEVDVETLVRHLPERCDLVDGEYLLTEQGTIVVQKELIFDGHATGQFVQRPVEGMTPELREFAIRGVFREHIGDESILPQEVQDFRRALRELRELDHHALYDLGVDGLIADIQEDLERRIPAEVEALDDIREYLDANFVRGFVSNEQRRAIMESAPRRVWVDCANGEKMAIRVRYQDHAAVVQCQDHMELRTLPDYIPELDGRKVYVRVGDEEPKELAELKRQYLQSRRERRGGEGASLPMWLDSTTKRTFVTNESNAPRQSGQRFSSRAYR